MGRPFEKKYDSQFIIYFDGTDKAAEQNAEYLVAKAAADGILDKTKIIELKEIKGNGVYDLSEYKSLAKGRVHVYVVGHGTESSQNVGGCRAEQLAKIINSLSVQKIKRISIVACHAGGNGSTIAPHRFVSELWDHAKGFVEEVSGYTGTVHMELGRYKNPEKGERVPNDAIGYKSWSGEQWLLYKGGTRKVVGREHDEGSNVRKVYFSSQGGGSRGWTGKNM
jgi:hypothetical protein